MSMRTPACVVLDAAVLGPLRHAPGRTALAIAAIALGVALGFSIFLINRVAADEVSVAARSLFGLADLAVESAGAGFDEALYPVVARMPGIKVASPVVQVEARLVGQRGTLTLLGMDVFRSRQLQPAFVGMSGSGAGNDDVKAQGEPVVLSASAARSLKLAAGDRLRVQVGLQPQEFVVAGVLPAAALGDRAGVIDIATAQWRFDRLGRLSRLNLRLADGASADQLRQALVQTLPAGVRVFTPEEAANDATRLSRAYRSNLTALALVALFTGGFFVYSTQSLAALRRRREFALLHALGVTRTGQALLTLLGAAIIGVSGALLGIAAGFAMARFGVSVLGADLGAGLFRGGVPVLQLHFGEAAAFCVLGLLVSIAGSAYPALEASRVPTAMALKASDVTSGDARPHGVWVLAILMMALAVVWLPPVAGLPLPGYVSIALLIIGTVVAMPSVLSSLLAVAPRLGSVPWELALAHLRGTARHATLSVCAIVVSFSLMVAMAIMVTSFRNSLDAWMQRILPADLYVRAGYIGQTSHLDTATVALLRDVDGVTRIAVSRFAEAEVVAGNTMTVIARDLQAAHPEQTLWLEESTDAPVPAGTVPVWISQAAADELDLGSGDSFGFLLATRPVQASIRGIWRDYEHPRGAIVMEHDTYVDLSGDAAINTVWLWLHPDASEAAVQQQIRDRLPAGAEYDMRTPRELRRLSLQAFDRTFAVTYALEFIAIVIGLFGIAAGTVRRCWRAVANSVCCAASAVTRAQIAATLAIEGAGLGALAVVAGLATGAVVSLIPEFTWSTGSHFTGAWICSCQWAS